MLIVLTNGWHGPFSLRSTAWDAAPHAARDGHQTARGQMETQTTTPTTSAAAPAAVSAPTSGVTTTASAAPTPAERPKTMAEAFARDAAPATTDLTTPPEGATTLPVEGTEVQSEVNPSTTQGPIPFEVHQKSLANARTKAVDEFRQTAGIDKAVEFAGKINANPAGFLGEYITELLTNPQQAPAAKAVLARMFGGLRQQAAAKAVAAEPMPAADVEIRDDTGQVVGRTYSADQLDKRDAWREKQSLARTQQAEQARKASEARATEQAQQVESRSNDVIAEISDTLEFDDKTSKEQRDSLISEVNKLLVQNPRMSAHRAALEVRKTHILPALAGKAEANVLESLRTKAAAQAVNPAGAVVAATTRPRSFLDKSLQW